MSTARSASFLDSNRAMPELWSLLPRKIMTATLREKKLLESKL